MVPMPASSQKKKRDSGSQALGAAETEATKESEEASFGDDEDDLMSPKGFLNDKTADFQQLRPQTFKDITAVLSDEASVMIMISAYEGYENKDEFDELLSLNVDVLIAMIAIGCFSEAAFQGLYRALLLAKDSGSTSDVGPYSKEIALVEGNITNPTKDDIRKKFEGPKGRDLLLNRWTVSTRGYSKESSRVLSKELV